MFDKVNEGRIINERAWKRYRRLIENASYTGYTEKHHILPKAKDCWPEYAKNPENIVNLSARAHFIAHLLLSRALGGSQIAAFVLMVRRKAKGRTAKHRETVRVNSRLYDEERNRLREYHSRHQKNRVTVVDGNGYRFKVSLDDPRIASGELVKYQPRTKGVRYTNGKTTIYVKHGEPIPDGFYHHNHGKAAYLVNGERVRLRTDDPLVLSGEAVAASKGRTVSEENKKRARALLKGTVCVRLIATGEVVRVKKDELKNMCQGTWEHITKKGHKKSRTEAYVEVAKNRPRLCCIQCGREVPVNIFGRYHGEKCKWQK